MRLFSRFLLGLGFGLAVLGLLFYGIFPTGDAAGALVEQLEQRNPALAEAYRAQRAAETERGLWLLFGALGALTLFLTLYFYFLFVQPVFQISRHLANRSIHGLEPLARSSSEFGEMARLLTQFLRQGKMLEDEVRGGGGLVVSETEKGWVLGGESLDRERLARDLHDGVIQSVYALGLQVSAWKNRQAKDGSAVRPEELEQLERALAGVVREIRGVILHLEPSELADRDLDLALDALKNRLGRVGAEGVDLDVEDGVVERLPRAMQVDLYFMVSELLSNALRHGRATRFQSRIAMKGGEVCLTARNEGVGERMDLGGSGLGNLERRLQAYGGTLEIQTEETGVFAVEIRWPLPEKASP